MTQMAAERVAPPAQRYCREKSISRQDAKYAKARLRRAVEED